MLTLTYILAYFTIFKSPALSAKIRRYHLEPEKAGPKEIEGARRRPERARRSLKEPEEPEVT